MADNKAKKPDAATTSAESAAAAPPKSAGRKKLIGIVGAVMIVEGVGVFGAMKMMGSGPGKTVAAAPLVVEKPAPEKIEEVEIAQVRAPNVKEGKLVLWSLHVAIRANCGVEKEDKHEAGAEHDKEKEEGEAKAAEKSKAESPIVKKIKMNERTIKDRMARIVRSAEPQYLQEDGLETIKRQIKFELERTLGEDVKIVEVLVPECTPYPTGF